MAFAKTIVGIDGSDGGRDAIKLAQQLSSATSGELVLANVFIESMLPARGSAGIFKGGIRRESQDLLETARNESGVDAELCSFPSSYVGRGLHELADRIGADLLVVGSARHGLLGRVLLGDALRAALNGAPCAVAVAPAGYAQRPALINEIGVGYDGSPESRHALDVARELAGAFGARVSAFQAVSLPLEGFVDPRRFGHETLEMRIEQARQEIAALGDVEPHAAYGDPGEELALYGASVDLLIVGARGYGPVGRMVHGHTSMHLARAARCPLLVLPRAAAITASSRASGDQESIGTSAG